MPVVVTRAVIVGARTVIGGSVPESVIEPHWLSVEGAKTYTSLSRDTIVAAIRSGDLAAYLKPATFRRNDQYRQYRISTEDLDAWMRSQPPARECV